MRELHWTVLLCISLFGLGACGLCEGAQAQAVLYGRVTDASGDPVPGANVYREGTTDGVATDRGGRYRLPGLETGAQTIVVSAVADSTNRYVLVSVSAPWCGWCQKMKREVYPSAPVQQCLARYYVVTRINPDAENRTYTYRDRRVGPGRLTALLGGDGGIPGTIILSPSGDSLVQLSGYLESQMLADVLAYVGTGAHRRASFRSYRTSAPAGCPTRSRIQGDASATMHDSLFFPRSGKAIQSSGG